jgi:subtilisin family serine protease
MGSKDARRGIARNRSIELLEDRRVMSADPLAQALGGSIQHHTLEQPPALVQHARPDADFWIDSASERDMDVLLGDIEQTLASAHGSTGLTTVRNDYGFIGTGQTVAVIDSGIAWNHTALGGGLGANYRVVGGWDFTENDSNPYDDGPSGSHGTHVAGIVGANRTGTADDGVAPGVDLVGLRVFDDAGAGYFNWVESALQWVHQNRSAFENPITAVNLSLGTTWNSNTVPSWSTLENEFAQLKADGIFVAVSAGNSFASYNAPGLSYPAASPHVVPVMSVMDNGSLSSFSQRHSRAIAAPGQYIVSTVPDYAGNHNGVNDDYASYSGTSMASPYVAGASVLLREAMQFVGYTNITQDTIYNHMMATATTFFDAATNQNYKRINLTNAFNALMPGDDYGSTTAAAYNLGSLSGTSEISGLIGKLSDADYFRFTASATGTVTFTASTTHSLAPVWNASGGTVSGSHGETYTFDVVAGQSYTIGLSTSGGIGYYDLSIEAESAFTYVDWGTITQSQTNNLSNTGESWYRLNASRAGYLTAESFFATSDGNVDLAFYDSNLQLLASGGATASGERVDVLANVGADYFLRVSGSNSDIDFRLTNLVSQSGNTVNVAGTAATDTFSFAVGATHHTVSVNGATYQFNKAAVTAVNIAGAGGVDSISMTGSSGADTATLRVQSAQLVGDGYVAVVSSVENVTVYGGGGSDVARLYGSAGNDDFRGYSDHAVLNGSGYGLTVFAFNQVHAYAGQGVDRAYFYDSAGDDTYVGRADRAAMYGSGYRHDAYTFDQTYAYATQGVDRASFYDSAGDDTYGCWSDSAIMYGGGYRNEVHDFDRTDAFASQGNDRATFRDSAGNDTYTSWSNRAAMYGTNYWNEAQGFDSCVAYASVGDDRATLRDSTGNDVFSAWSNRAVMAGAGYSSDARGFDRTFGLASAGIDLAELYDSAGDDLFLAWSDRAVMSGPGFSNDARGFDRANAYATLGSDESIFYDTAGDDYYDSWWNRALMRGDGYWNDARGFDRTRAHATTGYDQAVLRDSTAYDEVHAAGSNAYIAGANYRNEVDSFDCVDACDTDGDGSDAQFVEALDYLFRLVGNWS